ncbi:MAG: alpha/beta fold hydrolase [Myxococcota bacterium]
MVRRSIAMSVLLLCVGGVGCGSTRPGDYDGPYWRLRGYVEHAAVEDEPVFAVLQQHREDQWKTVDFARVDRNGAFEFIVDPRWSARIAAFVDTSGDGLHQPSESSAVTGAFDPAVDRENGVRDGIVVQLRAATAVTVDMPRPSIRSIYVGEIASLEDERFSAERSELGVSDPLEFMRDVGAGLFLLEPWRGEQPVFFVHGLGGSPREFAAMVESLPAGFQAVVAHYPSGWRLDDVALYFDRIVREFEARFDAERSHFVAHSMGGMVMRKALGLRSEDGARIGAFVTIASPLGGHPRAHAGVRYAPSPTPSWRDLDTTSRFVRDLYRERLPRGARYTLISTTEDDVVPVNTQLRQAAQREAHSIVGIPAGHVDVLSHPRALQVVGEALRSAASAAEPPSAR